jgi:hypothetical protein
MLNIVMYRPTARQRFGKHIPATTNTSVAMQRAVDTTIEEDVFSICPPRGYISSLVVNQKSVVQRRTRTRMERVLAISEVGRSAIAL